MEERGKICEKCGWNTDLEKNHIYPKHLFKDEEKTQLLCSSCHKIYTYISIHLSKWFLLDKEFFDWLSKLPLIEFNSFFGATKKFEHEISYRIFKNIYPNVWASEFGSIPTRWHLSFSEYLILLASMKGLKDK